MNIREILLGVKAGRLSLEYAEELIEDMIYEAEACAGEEYYYY